MSTAAESGSVSSWLEAERSRRDKGVEGISAREYDFSDVPEEELHACVHYEYARESATIVKEVEDRRAGMRRKPRPSGTLESCTKKLPPIHDALYLFFCICMNPFLALHGWI
jgi:hypothetical protein